MKWVIVTCAKSRHIVPVQQYLFNKFAPEVELVYLDVNTEPVHSWGGNVLKRLPNDLEFCVFGLDDYLPTSQFDRLLFDEAAIVHRKQGYDRFELGYGAHRKEGMIVKEFGEMYTYLEYGPNTPYSVSCQFSIWRMNALKTALAFSSTPWDFEINRKAKAACFSYPVMRWIEESALSRKWEGINLNGLDEESVDELIRFGLLKRSEIKR